MSSPDAPQAEHALDAWRQAAARELAPRGATPDPASVDRLTVRSPEGLPIEPVYPDRAEDRPWSPSSSVGAAPFVRGGRAPGTPWLVGALHQVACPAAAGAAIAEDVERGVDAIVVGVDRAGRLGLDAASELSRAAVGDGGTALVTAHDLAVALAGVDLARTTIWIDAGANASPFAAAMLGILDEREVDPGSARIFTSLDVAGALARDGAVPRPLAALADEAHDLVRAFLARGLGGRPLAVSGVAVHEAGGHAAHEIGFVLAGLVEILRGLDRRGLSPREAAAAVALEIAVGGDVFAAIAKVRALRLGWSQVLAACGVSAADMPAPFVAARTSARSLSTLDRWTNAVRATTEAFAAAVAGVDLLVVSPFDQPLGGRDPVARRLARNTQLILREEARLADVADPGGGSGWIEAHTEGLARAAWAELGRLDAGGGLLASLQAGEVQTSVRAAAEARGRDVARRRTVLVGVNDFAVDGPAPPPPPVPDPGAVARAAERAIAARQPIPTVPDDARVQVAASVVARGGTFAAASQVLAVLGRESPPSCDALEPRRDAARFEGLRAQAAALGAGAAPVALLMTIGPPAERRAREDFTRRLLEVGGFRVERVEVDPPGEVDPVAAAARSVAASGAPLACLCGPDERYAALAEPLARAITAIDRPDGPPVVVMAGRPGEDQPRLREAGVSAWLHLGGDAVELFTEVLARLDVRAARSRP